MVTITFFPVVQPAGDPAGDKERGKYDQYHDYLDKLERDRDQRKNNPQPGMDLINQSAALKIRL